MYPCVQSFESSTFGLRRRHNSKTLNNVLPGNRTYFQIEKINDISVTVDHNIMSSLTNVFRIRFCTIVGILVNYNLNF